jgi:hypothetical protein
MAAPILLAYAFDAPVPGPEIIAMLKRVEAECFGGIGEENGAPPLRASCGESNGIAFWSLGGGWEVGDGRAVADAGDARATRPVSGSPLELEGTLHELRFDLGRAWANERGALAAFAGSDPAPPARTRHWVSLTRV